MRHVLHVNLKRHPESTPAVRCAGRALARNTGCRRRFEFCASTQGRGQGRLGLPVLRRPAHGCVSPYQRRSAAIYRSAPRSQSKCQASSRLQGRQPWGPGLFSQYPSIGSAQASLVCPVPPALVCSAIQIQSKAAAHRAWPNPSFKRTCLRQAA